MKRFINGLFYISIGLLPIGLIFRIQHWPGGNTFFSLGLLGLFTYFIARTVKDLVKKRSTKFNITLQILTAFMTVILFSKYLHHGFGDYPGLLIVPLFIGMALFYLIKGKDKFNKLTSSLIAFLILSIPLFCLEFQKSPIQYIPKEWYNKTESKSGVAFDQPYNFRFKETEQLSIKAFDLKKSKQYSDAILTYRQAIKIEPNNPRLYFDLSECYFMTDKLESAISVLDTTILIDSTYAEAYGNRGLFYYKLNKNKKAIRDYQKAIQLDSTQPVYHANIALVYYYENDFDKACKAIQNAEQLGMDLTGQELLTRIKKEYCK